MTDYVNEIREISKHIKGLLSYSATVKITGMAAPDLTLMQQKADSLRQVFITTADQSDYASRLEEWSLEAPETFKKQWKLTMEGILNYENDPLRAIRLLARFTGWACIESYWTSQNNSFAPYGARAKLAAIVLNINPDLSEGEILSVLHTHRELLAGLLLDRFESQVKGGLNTIVSIEKNIEGKITSWEGRLDDSEKIANDAQSKIDAYAKSLEKYQVAFGFLGLTAAFKNFFERKEKENKRWGTAAVVFGLTILLIAALSHFIVEKFDQKIVERAQQSIELSQGNKLKSENAVPDLNAKKNEVSPVNNVNQQNQEVSSWLISIAKYLPIVAVEILLLYFFRIALTHFNSTKAQLLQLEIRMALCGFIDDYMKFAKENKGQDLSKFEAMVFSSIAPDEEKIPSTFDGVEQLANLIKSIKGKN